MLTRVERLWSSDPCIGEPTTPRKVDTSRWLNTSLNCCVKTACGDDKPNPLSSNGWDTLLKYDITSPKHPPLVGTCHPVEVGSFPSFTLWKERCLGGVQPLTFPVKRQGWEKTFLVVANAIVSTHEHMFTCQDNMCLTCALLTRASLLAGILCPYSTITWGLVHDPFHKQNYISLHPLPSISLPFHPSFTSLLP